MLLKRTFISLIAVCSIFSCSRADTESVRIVADYPSANIALERSEGNVFYMHQDLRDTQGNWFYWNFKAVNVGGKTLTFNFTKTPVIESAGPCFSIDGGKTWQWLGVQNCPRRDSFTHTLPPQINEVWYALSIPYQLEDFRRFEAAYKNDARFVVKPLAQTLKGAQNFYVKISEPSVKPKPAIFLSARHHACESVASYVLEGFMAELLSGSPQARALLERADFIIVPFVDLDGVENGDQGKNRKPHDHNRDYGIAPIYPEVAAIKNLLESRAQSASNVIMALDLHCPSLGGRGGAYVHDNVIYIVGNPEEKISRNQTRFSEILEKTNRGALPYRAPDNMPYGKSWNTLKEPISFARWAAGLSGIEFSASLETPYSVCSGVIVTPENAREFGATLAHTAALYLEESDKIPQ